MKEDKLLTEKEKWSIKSDPVCQYKWTWSTIFLSTGTSSSCHRCKGWDVSSMMSDFNNHPGKVKDRENMLEGKWPGNGCEYCKKIEDAGGTSERTGFINDEWLKPPEMVEDPLATSVTPRILEVYFNNLCNQKCLYCSPYFSSLIQHEVDKFGPLGDEYHLDGFEQREDYEDLKDQFWVWMDNNSQELRQFQILGGEPFYIPEWEECLKFFEDREHPRLRWKIFSNLKHTPRKFKKVVARLQKLIDSNKILSFQVVCSIDNWGPQGELARHGMDLKVWEENFNTMLYDSDIEIMIHSTISPVTMSTMPDLYRKVMEWRKVKFMNVSWNIIANPTFMAPEIMGHHFGKYFDELLDIVKDIGHWRRVLEGFKQQVVSHEVDFKRLTKLENYLDNIDRRRNTDWRSLYPEIVEVIETNPDRNED